MFKYYAYMNNYINVSWFVLNVFIVQFFEEKKNIRQKYRNSDLFETNTYFFIY